MFDDFTTQIQSDELAEIFDWLNQAMEDEEMQEELWYESEKEN